MPVRAAFRRQRQKDHIFRASLVNTVRVCLKMLKKKKGKGREKRGQRKRRKKKRGKTKIS